jgi:hypothetical protein
LYRSKTMNTVLLKDSFFTASGMLRIRWWPLALLAAVAAAFAIINGVTLAMLALGAQGAVADPFWHAPIFFLFGR